MSYTVEVSLQEVKAFVEFDGITLNPLGTIPFSANKDTNLDFADTIEFAVDNPVSSNFYYWELENENGYKRALGQSVKQDYAGEGLFDVNLIASDTTGVIGTNYKENFVNVDFQLQTQLLDDVPGAAAAYSIRLLRQDYSDGLLRVRAVDGNGTDQGEADVQDLQISDGRYIDLNSPIENLDSTAQGRGLSNSDTLGDLVDSGNSNYDGFIPTCYDQSGNARHATNTTASEQPKIVDAGSLIEKNNKPTLDFKGGQFLEVPSSKSVFTFMQDAGEFYNYVVCQVGKTNDPDVAYGLFGTAGQASSNIGYNFNYNDRSAANENNRIISLISNGNQKVVQLDKDNTLIANKQQLIINKLDPDNATLSERGKSAINGNSFFGNNSDNGSPTSNNSTYNLTIGKDPEFGLNLVGFIQELTIVNNPFNNNKSLIEGNVNGFFNAY